MNFMKRHNQPAPQGILDEAYLQPPALFGATVRPISMQSMNQSSNPFGLNLSIPSLPKLDTSTGTVKTTEPSIPHTSFFGNLPEIENPVPKDAPIQNLKKVQAKDSKVKPMCTQTLWNMMPYVEEHQLASNLKASSGIQRFWEDESLHIHMRNLEISESGSLSLEKE